MSLKISVLGCGYWGKNHVRNFFELGFLHSVCDPDKQTAEKFAQEYKVPAFSFEDILKDPSCSGIVIATPAGLHASLAERALEAGKHVFVEKPLTLDIAEAEALCLLAHSKQRILMVGHILQYHKAYLKLKEMVSKGELGKLQYIYSNRLNLGKIRTEENVWWNMAPHDVSMVLGLVNELPTEVYATGAAHLNSQLHDIATAHLNFSNGVKAHIHVSWLHPFKQQMLVVIGDKGMAVFDDCLPWDQKLSFYDSHVVSKQNIFEIIKGEQKFVPLENDEPLKRECLSFVEAIKTGIPPITDGEEGLRVLQVLTAAQESMDQERRIELKKSQSQDYFAHESAYVDEGAIVGKGTKIWHFSHILKDTKIGEQVIIGQNVMIGPDVQIGNRCKIQNNVSLYKGTILEDGVFCGPSCVFTNVNTPRAEIERKEEFLPTLIKRGATIGANATIVCGNTLGAYSFIAAGAVVTKEVPAHALMAGVPARRIGWVSHAGEVLGPDLHCPREGRRYRQIDIDTLEEIINE
ncbi:MAG: Gfo/Idh/MocA family oxidoreductase [Candidatus Paracaedimonas acanthamoebae]|uniref:Gfo/Idh/MocA family oxidoreductase n=1 Tax=Candidatus Paracaedimonas acanthamoebae TaxID=244581 RepID=A0A8J7PS47_9PROT|nr:Gfo/Idh/MocA family oxidoreductase [Candidatus Paracaedimonas acanthamoebae]